MSAPRRFFGGRNIANRNTFDRINPKYVPPSRHAIFIRGFPSDFDNHKIREFFQEASKSTCGIDFTSYNEELRKLNIALRFESHDIAKEMLMRYNNTEIFGCRVDITWFKDLKKARDRMIDEKRVPYDDHRMNYRGNRNDYDRRDNRDWSDNRRRYQPNSNNNHSRSIDRGEVNSDASYGNRKHSSDYERSRSKSSAGSLKSDSVSADDHERRSPPIKEGKTQRSQLGSLEKPSAYRVDLDEMPEAVKPVCKPERFLQQNDHLAEDENEKHDLDEKKKKKKKRKRRRLEHSGSQDSFTEPPKVAKYIESADAPEASKGPAIAGDLSNWKQTASDSDDYLTKSNQICKVKAANVSLASSSDKLNSEKYLKMLRLKVENVEKAYKKDSETYSSVVNILIRKAPELKTKLESLLKEILVDAGNQCVDSMRDYVLHLSDSSNNVDPSMSPASSV